VLLDLIDGWRAPQIVISDPAPGSEIGVSITGAVATPGTYFLPGDARIAHLVEAAGGVTDNADLSGLNMAARLRDEQQLAIPTLVVAGIEREAEATAGPAMGIAVQGGTRVNINTATPQELAELPGIGPALAQRIVDERVRVGQYGSVDELVRISGISQKMVDELRDQITT
jgi:competence protein ComEA